MAKDKNNVSGNSDTDNRTIRASIRERISSRASEHGGNASRSGGRDSNSGPDTSAPGSSGIPPASASPLGISGNTDGIIITDKSTDRGIDARDTGRRGSNSSTGSDGRTGTSNEFVTPAISLKPSTLNVTEVITNSDTDGLIIKDGRRKPGRPAGSKNSGTLKRAANIDLITPLKIACDFVFSIPTTFLGWGKHWQLSDEESDELASNIKDVLDAFPSETTVDFLKYLDRYMPLIVLGMTLYKMVSNRYRMTQQFLRQAVPTRTQVQAAPEETNVENKQGQGIITKGLVM